MRMILQSLSQPASDVYCFQFQPERLLDYIAGQFAEFTIDHVNPDQKGIRRWFTLSSSPTEPLVAITVRFRQQHTQSSFKTALLALRPGDGVLVGDPMGDFVLPLDNSTPLLWVAGGIGITPFHSMALWMTNQHEQRDIKLIHIVNEPQHALYAKTFKDSPIPEVTVLDSSKQRPSAQTVLDRTGDAAKRLVYISGPETMVETMRQQFAQAGFARNDIIVDQFLGYD